MAEEASMDLLSELPRELLVNEIIPKNLSNLDLICLALTSTKYYHVTQDVEAVVPQMAHESLRGPALFHEAILTGDMNLIRWARGYSNRKKCIWAITNAMETKSTEILVYILKEGFEIPPLAPHNERNPILVGARVGFTVGLRILHELKMLDIQNVSPKILNLAIRRDSVKILQWLEEIGANCLFDDFHFMRIKAETCLQQAHLGCLDFFLNASVSCNPNGYFPGFGLQAVASGNLHTVTIVAKYIKMSRHVALKALELGNADVAKFCLSELKMSDVDLYLTFAHFIEMEDLHAIEMLCEFGYGAKLLKTSFSKQISWEAAGKESRELIALLRQCGIFHEDMLILRRSTKKRK